MRISERPRAERIDACARAAHEANRAYCLSLGDESLVPWESSPAWQKLSVLAGVEAFLAHPTTTPAESHARWLAFKSEDGWTLGPIKDAERKTHPCMMPYDELPPAQRAKDRIFLDVVKTMAVALELVSAY